MTTTKRWRVVIGLSLCAVAVLSWWAYGRNRADASPRVTVAPVSQGSVVDAVAATGGLEAVTAVQVGSQVSGIIAWLGADFNSIVHKGEVIARLDPALLQAQVDQSRASLARTTAEAESARYGLTRAEQTQARISALFSKGVVSRSEFEAAELGLSSARAQLKSVEAQVLQAKATLEQQQTNLSRTVITAPIDGIVTQRSVDVGQTVSASMSSPTLFVIAADLTAMQVKAGIDESDIGRVAPSQRVSFQVDAYPGRSFEGVVRQVRLEPALTQNVVTYSVIINAPNPQLVLRPGMTANVKIEIARADDAIRIPAGALRFRPSTEMFAMLGQAPPDTEPSRARSASQPRDVVVLAIDDGEDISDGTAGHVWVERNNQLTQVPVVTGISDGQLSVLLDGDLRVGDELVTNISAADAAVRGAAPAGGIFMSVPGGGGGRGRIG